MAVFFSAVSQELELAFDRGEFSRRTLLSTAFGPNFSIFSEHFWDSLVRISRLTVGLGDPMLPFVAPLTPLTEVEADFDRLALRRGGLLQRQGWKLSGWVLDPARGLPQEIELDDEARNAGIQLRLVNRPDVAEGVLGIDTSTGQLINCGIGLSSPGPWSGHLIVRYRDKTTTVPIALFNLGARAAIDYESIHVEIDSAESVKSLAEGGAFKRVARLSTSMHHTMINLMMAGGVVFIVILASGTKLSIRKWHPVVLLAVGIALSVAAPRVGLLAAIDATMYPGSEPRYLAAASFSVWFMVSFLCAVGVRLIATNLLVIKKIVRDTNRK